MPEITYCQNCKSTLSTTSLPWLLHCKTCGLKSSLLNKDRFIDEQPVGWTDSAIDFLEQLRIDNAHIILKELSYHGSLTDKKLLDIGCAAGWFMRIAKEYGIHTIGIEPDENIASIGRKNGHTIETMMFPDESLFDQKVDLLSFNDVFEHIEDSIGLLDAVYHQLNDDGLLIINLPNADGVFYRIATVAAKFGYTSPLDRLWQKGYVSPHLHYFNNKNLQELCETSNFKLLTTKRLPSIQLKGLWQRIRHNDKQNIVSSSIMYAGMCIAFPIIRWVLPSDIIFHIYKKK